MSNLAILFLTISVALLGMTNISQTKELRKLEDQVDELEEKANKLPDDLK